MNDRFWELKKEKQDRMINAALKVFARYGYKHSSTDEIIREAGISKGLLFHYFESKIGLYSFLYDYVTRFVALELAQNVESGENGFFELYRQILVAKANSISQYPYVFLFLDKADEETDPAATVEIAVRREKYKRIMDALRDRADVTVLGSGIDYEKVWNLMDFAVEGMIRKSVRGENFRTDIFLDEAGEYVEIIKSLTIRRQL